jgi:hypothetical protein
MKLKNEGFKESNISIFSLIGKDENALSQSFAYFISKDINAYFEFIHNLLAMKIRKSLSHYKDVNIEVQKKRDEGFTDIEISYKNKYHIIIECKIKKGKGKTTTSPFTNSSMLFHPPYYSNL